MPHYCRPPLSFYGSQEWVARKYIRDRDPMVPAGMGMGMGMVGVVLEMERG